MMTSMYSILQSASERQFLNHEYEVPGTFGGVNKISGKAVDLNTLLPSLKSRDQAP